MNFFDALAANEILKARIERLNQMSDHCRRHPNDVSGFARIKRMKNELYDNIEANLQKARYE